MSFDVFLARYEAGVLCEAPRQAILGVLRSRSYKGPDQFGFYLVECEGSQAVEFSARGLESSEPFRSCAFHIRRFSDDLAQFIFEVASAGRMVIVPAMEGDLVLLVDEAIRSDLPPDMLNDLKPLRVSSSKELAGALAGGFQGWSEYRDHVVGRASSASEE